MKKFLSLLLALTLVLSLVVVPARATGDTPQSGITIAGKDDAKIGDIVAFSVPATATVTPGSEASESSQDAITATLKSCVWSVTGGTEVSSSTGASYEVRANVAGTMRVTCTATYQYGEGNANELSASALTKDVSVTTFSYNDITLKVYGKAYTPASAVNVNLVNSAEIALANIEVGNASGSPFTLGTVTYDSSTRKITIPATRDGVPSITPLEITLNVTPKTATNIIASNPNSTTVRSGQTLVFTSTYSGGDAPVSYVWTDGTSAANFTGGTTKSATWTAPNVTKETKYKISCTATEAGQAKKSNEIEVTVQPETNIFAPSVPSAMSRGGQQTLSFRFYNSSTNQEITLTSENNVTWSIESSGLPTASYLKVTNATGASAFKSATLTIPTSYTASSCKVKVTFTYNNKTYSYTYNISLSSLTAAISPIQNNTAVTLYGYNYGYGTSNNLFALAQAALATARIDATVRYVTLDTIAGSRTNCYIQQTSGSSSAYYTYTITGTSIGTASFTGTVYTDKCNYPITFTATVTPISTTYEAQYPEPVAYGNTYRYYVQVPAGASYYYVVGTPNQATIPTDFSQSGKTVYYANTTSTNLYPLTDSNFVNGQCTLWIVTKNSSDNKLYYGQLTVYQKNYNINYNGVAGETVQFAQSDFTDFMNEVAEARGDASKTKSYPYVTFDYVTFSLPTTSQGTLYYGGTAMSTSNSSGAFNTRTKVTNLDSVTFVPNAKTTAKTITLNFTLYATRYSSSSTSHGTTVPYSGTVVVNLVREDIKYTVSQGDSVRFDESDFLSYLRSTKGYTSNYTIDYVTFDQSAVSAVNEGSLYTYYNGYNYGGSVKTTDKFYYNATASQNALSDVAFLASRYAKTGETVYIPFTIYARYGSTGTGTRQLTGTVAIKIGQTMNFIDVKTTDYFYNSVKWAVGKNITNGTSSTTFSPYKSCTRAEIVTFLWRAAGSPEPTITRNPFRDVNAVTHSSYYKAILWASQKGITSGTSATAFSPDQVCTRAQIVTFLYRYAGQPSGYYSNPFKDVGATSEASYYNAILWAVGKGITTGTSATTFSPYASCNRAEAVTFLYRYTNGL